MAGRGGGELRQWQRGRAERLRGEQVSMLRPCSQKKTGTLPMFVGEGVGWGGVGGGGG